MKYPYIGESQFTGSEVLLASRSNGFRLDVENAEYCNDWDETVFKNITREYLTNTYGKVESQEHADFIVELAGNAGFELNPNYKDGEYFYISTTRYGFSSEKFCRLDGAKQITIPIPPKCDESLNNGDNLLFGGEDKCKEWPCVGEEVTFKHTKWNVAAKYNHMLMLVTHDDCGFALACKNDLQKPKTPEEELRDDIFQSSGIRSRDGGAESAKEVAGFLLSKYNITKKPQ